jgi:hypothetical protein
LSKSIPFETIDISIRKSFDSRGVETGYIYTGENEITSIPIYSPIIIIVPKTGYVTIKIDNTENLIFYR